MVVPLDEVLLLEVADAAEYPIAATTPPVLRVCGSTHANYALTWHCSSQPAVRTDSVRVSQRGPQEHLDR